MGTSLTATGVQFPDNSVQTAPALTGFRNRIINGGMTISQRGTSFPAANGFMLDRFYYGKVNDSAVTVSQSTDVPSGSGLSNSLRIAVTTADTSIAAGDYSILQHIIEGYNVADLVGTPFTISFWVKSSKTGTHCLSLRSSTGNRTYISEYIINSANTWEKKTITIQAGIDISGGSWNFTNGRGLEVGWSMATGSSLQIATPNSWVASNALATSNQVNCLDTVGNIFAITGVQLERGSTATDFEFRPYSVELAMCQRYYEKSYVDGVAPGSVTATGMWSSQAYSAAYYYAPYVYFKVTKRTTPSIVIYSVNNGAAGNMYAWSTGVNFVPASVYGSGIGTQGIQFYAGSGLTAGVEYACHWTASAEL